MIPSETQMHMYPYNEFFKLRGAAAAPLGGHPLRTHSHKAPRIPPSALISCRAPAPSASRTSTTRARNAKPTWMAPTSAPPSATSSCRPTGTLCPHRPRRPTSRGYLGSRSTAPPGRALRPRPADPPSPATVPPQLPRRPGVVPRLLPLLGQRSRCWRRGRVLGTAVG